MTIYYNFLGPDLKLHDGTTAVVGGIEWCADPSAPLRAYSDGVIHAYEDPMEGYWGGDIISGVAFIGDTITDGHITTGRAWRRVFILDEPTSWLILYKILLFCVQQAFDAARIEGADIDPHSAEVEALLERLVAGEVVSREELDAVGVNDEDSGVTVFVTYVADFAVRAAVRAATARIDTAAAAYAAADAARAAQREYLIALIETARKEQENES